MLDLRLGLVALVFVLLLGVVACGSSDVAPAATGPTPTPNPELADAGHGMAVSAKAQAQDTQIREAQFRWDVTRDNFSINGFGTFVVKPTGDMFLSSHYLGRGDIPVVFNEGNDSDLMITGGKIYFETPVLGNDWYVYTPQQFGEDLEVAQRLLDARSPLNLGAFASALTGATQIGSDTIDGVSYEHFRATIDAGALMNALADAYGKQGQLMIGNRFSGPVQTDFWIDPVSLLPQQVKASGQFTYLSGDTTLSLSLDFIDPKGGIDFPTTPSDAIPVQ